MIFRKSLQARWNIDCGPQLRMRLFSRRCQSHLERKQFNYVTVLNTNHQEKP